MANTKHDWLVQLDSLQERLNIERAAFWKAHEAATLAAKRVESAFRNEWQSLVMGGYTQSFAPSKHRVDEEAIAKQAEYDRVMAEFRDKFEEASWTTGPVKREVIHGDHCNVTVDCDRCWNAEIDEEEKENTREEERIEREEKEG